MTRISIDHDGDGAFVRITRPGAAAEIVPISHCEAIRLMSEVADAVLVEERARRGRQVQEAGDGPPHFIGLHGE